MSFRQRRVPSRWTRLAQLPSNRALLLMVGAFFCLCTDIFSFSVPECGFMSAFMRKSSFLTLFFPGGTVMAFADSPYLSGGATFLTEIPRLCSGAGLTFFFVAWVLEFDSCSPPHPPFFDFRTCKIYRPLFLLFFRQKTIVSFVPLCGGHDRLFVNVAFLAGVIALAPRVFFLVLGSSTFPPCFWVCFAGD